MTGEWITEEEEKKKKTGGDGTQTSERSFEN
jgi:hypothetical protein